MKTALAAPYDISARPAWTLPAPITQRVRHVKQTGAGSYFAIIT